MIKRIPLHIWLLLTGLLLLIIGVVLHYSSGHQGRIVLQQGKAQHLVLQQEMKDTAAEQTGLGFNLTLDSLRILPHTPVFEFTIMETTSGEDPAGMGGDQQTRLLRRHPVEMMQPIRIEDSDYYFRAGTYYPDFEFSYTYPEYRDTILPNVPGMMLRLHTADGPAVVTLRKDQPQRHTLGDIVGLGASFTFFWTLDAEDVLQAIEPEDTAALKILFSGSDQRLYRVFGDSVVATTFEENQFFSLSGKDSLGFTVLFAVADVNLLKAVPSSRSESPRNPVIRVEVWKKGGAAREVFLYPKMTGRTGGQFEVPGSNYTLGMEEDPEMALRHCSCYLTVWDDASGRTDRLEVEEGKAVTWKGYVLSPEACRDGGLPQASFMIHDRPGSGWMLSGGALGILGVCFFLWRRMASPGRKSA